MALELGHVDVAPGRGGPPSPPRRCARRRARDLLPAAVIERDHQREFLVLAREVLRLRQQRQDFGVETGAVADHAHAHAAAVQLRQIVAHEALQQAHQVDDLFGRPRPVLGAEAVDGEDLDAEIARGPHGLAQRLDAAPVALAPRQAARGGPAPIAVHDDGDMQRGAGRILFRSRGVVIGHGVGPSWLRRT